MPDRDEIIAQLHAAKQDTLTTWAAFRVAQIATTRPTLSEQAKLTVTHQDDVSEKVVDLKAFRTEVDAVIDAIQSDVERTLARVDEVDIMQGSGVADATWHQLYTPFAEILLANGYRPTELPIHGTPHPMQWRYYEQVRHTNPPTYKRSTIFRYPLASEELVAWRSATSKLSLQLAALEKFDQNARRNSIADAWGD